MASIAKKRSFANSEEGESLLKIVFWVIYHDRRTLADFELDRIVRKGIKEGFWTQAPRDEFGVRVSWDFELSRIRTARCGYVLTQKGLFYWRAWIRGELPSTFSPTHPINNFQV